MARSHALDCIDDPIPDPEGEKGLMPELAEVFHTLRWRMEREPWEEELPIAAEHEAVSMDTYAPGIWRGFWKFRIPLDHLQTHRREATRLVCKPAAQSENAGEGGDEPGAATSEGEADELGVDDDRVLVVPNDYILANLPNLSVCEGVGVFYVDLMLACGGGCRLGDCSTAPGVEFEQWML